MTTHQAQVPALVDNYFRKGPHPIPDDVHPIIAQEFYPDRGWRTTNYRKRVSCSWLSKLKREGVTHVGLSVPGGPVSDRIVDFSIAEILRFERYRGR